MRIEAARVALLVALRRPDLTLRVVLVAKLAQMHTQEPTIAVPDLKGVTSRTLVMVGDDDEVTLETVKCCPG